MNAVHKVHVPGTAQVRILMLTDSIIIQTHICLWHIRFQIA